MDKQYTIDPNHFSTKNLDHHNLLKLFHRYYPALKEYDIIFAFLSHDWIPSLLVFDHKHDRIDEYSFHTHQLIATHADAGLKTIRETTAFFQGSILIPNITRFGPHDYFRYGLTLHQNDANDNHTDGSLYLWDDPTNPRAIKLYDMANEHASIFTPEDELSFYLYLFQHYHFKVIGVDSQDVYTLVNKKGRVEITYDLCYHDPNNDVRKSTSFNIDDTHPHLSRGYVKKCIELLTLILMETNLNQIKHELKQEHDFIHWLKNNVIR